MFEIVFGNIRTVEMSSFSKTLTKNSFQIIKTNLGWIPVNLRFN